MGELQFKEGVQKLIDENASVYEVAQSRIVSDFIAEKSTTADYDKRQILELLQNTDDANTDKVLIQLNKKEKIFSISNNGDSFSLGGVKSLLLEHTSEKRNKPEYIGNKGLGFRSILNWTKEVKIKTSSGTLTFSPEIAVKNFERFIPDVKKRKQLIENESQSLEPNEVPFAVLAIPEFSDSIENDGWETIIKVKYKEAFEEEITTQLRKITSELLLFVNSITQIEISGASNDIDQIITKQSVASNNVITVDDSTWNIYDSGEHQYPNNPKKLYRYKIAWRDDLSDLDTKFFTYFPTRERIYLPCLIHATFDLVQSRDYFTPNNNENRYLLKEIATSIKEIAIKSLQTDGEKANWKSYLFLQPTGEHSNEDLTEFYKLLHEYREETQIYPCVDSSYITKEQAVYCGDEFSQWVLDNELGKEFPNLILPKNNIDIKIDGRYTIEVWKEIIGKINNKGISVQQRAELIAFLIRKEAWNKYFSAIHSSDEYLPLLLNEKGDVVSPTTQVFTKDTHNISYDFSHYEDIDFISNELYSKIKEKLKADIAKEQTEKESGPSRAIKRLLKGIVNIGSDDIIDVIQHIISQTNRKITNKATDNQFVVQMVHALFSIYKSNTERKNNLTSISNIPLVARSGEIVYSDKLFFGKDYNAGVSVERIFEGIKDENDYLAAAQVYGLNEEEDLIDGFFTWLNVNRFSRFRKIDKKCGRWDNTHYTSHMLKWANWPKEDVHKHYNVDTIEGFETILKHPSFTIERLVAWIAKDETFKAKLYLSNSDEFIFQFAKDRRILKEKPSYLSFLIEESNITKSVLANIPIHGLDVIKTINYKDELFQKLQLKNYEIDEVLDLLHIKSSFNELHPDVVYSLLREVVNLESSNSRQYYLLIYDYFKANEEGILKDYTPDFAGINYYCRKGGTGKKIETASIGNVYYSANKLLPQSKLNDYAFINLPPRISEKRIKDYFGVSLIKDFSTNIISSELHSINDEFQQYITRLKPYFLAHRLLSLKLGGNKKQESSLIKKLNINLVSNARVTIDNDEPIELGQGEFIPHNDTFILRGIHCQELSDLLKNADFCDSVAEIISITFKINDLSNTFRQIFKDDIPEAKHIIRTNELESYLHEAEILLGIPAEKKRFWNSLFPKAFEGYYSDETVLKNRAEELIKKRLPDYYSKIDFSNLGDNEGIQFLKWLSEIVEVKLQDLISENTLQSLHKEQLNNHIKNYSKQFEYRLWKQANESEDLQLKELFFKRSIEFDDAIENGAFEKFIIDSAFCIEPDFNSAVTKYALEKFNISLNGSVPNIIEPTNQYTSLFKQYKFGYSNDDREKRLKSDYPLVYSLIFFEGHEDIIQKHLDILEGHITSEPSNKDVDAKTDGLSIIKSKIGKVIPPKKGKKRNSGTYSHSSKRDRNNARAGKLAEDKVEEALLREGYDVINVAKKRDTKHYDLEYKKKGCNEWRYLEVKKDSGGFFFLSKAEKETAMMKQNREKYDIAIVNDETIHIIEKPFDFQDESFGNNSTFFAEPSEYKISYNINE